MAKKRSYYDVIAGLAAFEFSLEVTFNTLDLQVLVKQPDAPKKLSGTTDDDYRKKGTIVQGVKRARFAGPRRTQEIAKQA